MIRLDRYLLSSSPLSSPSLPLQNQCQLSRREALVRKPGKDDIETRGRKCRIGEAFASEAVVALHRLLLNSLRFEERRPVFVADDDDHDDDDDGPGSWKSGEVEIRSTFRGAIVCSKSFCS